MADENTVDQPNLAGADAQDGMHEKLKGFMRVKGFLSDELQAIEGWTHRHYQAFKEMMALQFGDHSGWVPMNDEQVHPAVQADPAWIGEVAAPTPVVAPVAQETETHPSDTPAPVDESVKAVETETHISDTPAPIATPDPDMPVLPVREAN